MFKQKQDTVGSIFPGMVDSGFQNTSFVAAHLLVLDLLP